MLSSLDKSEFDPVKIQTTTFPSIYDFIYSKAATPNAPAGSTIIPLSYKVKIDVAILPS